MQRIVDEVRFRLQSGDCELNDELKRLAGEFAGLCHAINTRLRRCGDFLKQGLRAEAIQLADAEPNLLDSYATVDFPERAEWDAIVSMYQLPAAEPLLSDVAQDLNEAYSLQQPLEKLLDRHRLLALCRAPLSQRLAVVRKLAVADPGSRFWEEDIRDFEEARCNELEGEARAASAAGDEAALASLLGEISSAEWRQRPSASVVNSVKKLALQVLADQLQAAYVHRNLDRGRMLRDQWNGLVPRSSAGANGVSGNVAPALKWLAAEDSKSQALQTQYAKLENLEQLLAEPDASLAELEQARRELLQSRHDLPEALANRLGGRIRLLRQEAVSGRRRTLAAVVGGSVLAVALFAFFVWANLRQSAANRIANSTEQLITQGNLRQARELLDSNPWMSTMEQYLTVHGKLVEAEKHEQTRVDTLKAAIDRAQSAASAQEAELAIAEADRLAISIDERRMVEDVKGRWSRMAKDTAQNEDNRFQQQLSDLTDLLDRLERLRESATPDPSFKDLLQSAEAKCRDLRQTSAHVKPALVPHVDAAEARLARLQKAAASSGKRAAFMERLMAESAAISEAADPEARIRQFCQSLREFGDTFPSDPSTSQFAEAANELDLWRGIMRWQQLARQWKTLLPRTVTEARARAAACNAWLREHAATPPALLMREYLAFSSSVIAREQDSSGDEKEGLRQKLLGLFSGPLVEDVEMFVTQAGERYYVRGKYVWAEGKPIRYLAGLRGEQKSMTIKPADVNVAESHESPQSALRRKVRDTLAHTTLANWDHALREIAEGLRTDHDLDPFLRYYILLRVLEFAKEGNSIAAGELEPVIKELQGFQVKLAARWMDPKDDEAQTARKTAQRALNSVKPLQGPFDRADERGREFGNQLFEQMVPVGCLVADAHGRWGCLSAASVKPKTGAALWMTVPAKDKAVATWIKVGDQASGNQLTLAKGVNEQLCQGRLLFIRSRMPANPRDGE
jgi:hypothetical protein